MLEDFDYASPDTISGSITYMNLGALYEQSGSHMHSVGCDQASAASCINHWNAKYQSNAVIHKHVTDKSSNMMVLRFDLETLRHVLAESDYLGDLSVGVMFESFDQYVDMDHIVREIPTQVSKKFQMMISEDCVIDYELLTDRYKIVMVPETNLSGFVSGLRDWLDGWKATREELHNFINSFGEEENT